MRESFLLYVTDAGAREPLLRHAVAEAALGLDVAIADGATHDVPALIDGCELVVAELDTRHLSVARALELCEAAASRPPLIVVSDGATDDVAADCLRRGAVDYLRTPDVAALAAALRRATAARHAAQQRLHENAALLADRQRLRIVSELATDYAYSLRIDAEGRVAGDWILGAFTRITGYRPTELDTQSGGLSIIHPEDRPIALQRLRGLLDGETNTVEYRVRTKRGEVRWLRDTASPEWDATHRRIERISGVVRDVTDQKRVEHELARVQRQRQNVMETVPDVIYMIDLDGRLQDWNQRLEMVTGLATHELTGRSALEFFAPADRAKIAAAIQQGFVTGYVQVEANMLVAGGSVRRYQYTGVPLCDAQGTVVGLTGVGRDIVDLQQAQRRTAMLLDAARDISGTLDRDELLARVQRRAAAMLGCDMVATFCWDARTRDFPLVSQHGLPPALLPALEEVSLRLGQQFLARLGRGESVVVNDTHGLEALRGFPAGALIATPLRVGGRPLGALIGFRARRDDFTSGQIELCEGLAAQLAVAMEAADLYRVQQEEARVSGALARVGRELIAALGTDELLERLCRVTVDVLGADTSHTILHMAADDAFTFVAGHGYTVDEWQLIRMVTAPSAWLPAESLRSSSAESQILLPAALPPSPLKTLADEMGISTVLFVPLRRGDRLIGFQGCCYRSPARQFTAVQQRILSGIAQLASLTLEHSKTVEALAEASRLKSDFVATMSHELRTPLNVILGYNELLLGAAFGPLDPQQYHVLRRMDRSARELQELITATLDMSRIEAGKLTIDVCEVDIVDLLREVEEEILASWDKPAVRFSWHVAPGVMRIHTDGAKLKVILKNLLGNARKFTEAGDVCVSADPHPGGIELSVADTGIGIAPEMEHYIFEAFRQGDSSPTRRHDGAGLGLYIVRRLLDLLGGGIAVETAVARGTTFRVRLPVTPQQGAIAA